MRCQGVGCTPWRHLGLRLFCVAGVAQCALPATPADSDSAGSAADSAAESSAVGSSWPDLQKSPPPVLKSNWKAAAGKHVKKPASKRSLAKGQKLKKPAAESKSSGSSKDGARGGPDAIHLPSVKLGGGKAQSYIQHMPDGPDGSKRLIVSCLHSCQTQVSQSDTQSPDGRIAANMQGKGSHQDISLKRKRQIV